jgi:hypothetical protein
MQVSAMYLQEDTSAIEINNTITIIGCVYLQLK